MADITIQADSFDWVNKRTVGLELWIFSSIPWTDVDGEEHGAGNQDDHIFTRRVAGVTNNTTTHRLSVPAFDHPPTRNAIRGNSVLLFFWVMQVSGTRVTPIKQIPGTEFGLTIPASLVSASPCSPAGTCATWADLIVYNSVAPAPARESYLQDIERLVIAALGSAQGPAGTGSELQFKNNSVFGAIPGSVVTGANIALGGHLSVGGDLAIEGIFSQSIGGANPLVPTDQVTPITVGIASAGVYADSVGGNIFQISSQIRNDGSTPVVAVFGQAYADGPMSHALGANFTGDAHFAGAIATALEADHRCTAAGAFSTGITIFSSGEFPTSQHMFIASNTEASRPAFGIIIGVISGVQPLTDSGTILTVSGPVATGVGIDFSAASFLNGLMRGPNNAPIFMKNSAGVSIPVLNVDGSNFTTLRSGGAGFVIGNALSTANLVIVSDAPPVDGNTCLQIQVTKGAVTSTVQVGVGAPDSGGSGVRALVIAN